MTRVEGNRPLVSFVMAVFNAERLLPRALASIRHQTYEHWELIAIDDASTDGTRAVLDDAARGNAKITVLHQAANRGLAACLNVGWRAASGELIARMDADDFSMAERLERQVRFIETHPEVAVLGTAAKLVDSAGRELGMARRPEHHEDLVGRMYKETPFMHPTVVMRRAFLETLGGYDDCLRRSQDVDLWLRAYRRFRFHNLQEPLIEYRVPDRPSRQAMAWGTFVLARSAYREGMLLRRGWYAPRYLAATGLAHLGLRRLRIA